MKKLTSYESDREYYNIALALDKKGNVINGATNIVRYFSGRNHRPFMRSIHAEKALVMKMKRNKKNPTNYSVMSLRFRSGKIVSGGNPCNMCRKMLNTLNKEVFYY